MGEHPVRESELMPEHLVQDVLKNLTDITKRTKENEEFKDAIAGQLKNIGYDYFPEDEGKLCSEHVIKILKVAINNTMRTTDLNENIDGHNDDDDESDITDEPLGKKLADLLEINDGKCVEDYFNKGCFALMFYILPNPPFHSFHHPTNPSSFNPPSLPWVIK